MQVTTPGNIDQQNIREWITHKLPVQKIEEVLKAKGLDSETISVYLREFNKQRYAIRRSKGFFFASIGAFVGFIGCLIAIIDPVPVLYNLGLYGFTSLAAVLIIAGLYFLFE